MEWLNFFESNLFSNIINTFSAIGTIGAVIVSLYFDLVALISSSSELLYYILLLVTDFSIM